MKNLKQKFSIVALLLVAAITLTFCTKNDEVLNPNPLVTPQAVLNTDTLHSVIGTPSNIQPIGGGAWDGNIGEWSNAPALTVHATVPDLGNGTFEGYVGNSTDITLRSMYDNTYIYILAEFNTDQKSLKSALWYFNSTTHLWAQEKTVPVVNSDSATYRPAAAQDQLVMLFNISTPAFNSLSCYAACHVNSSYGGPKLPEGGVMYTNGPTERIDCWRARSLQVMNENQLNDCFIDDGASVAINGSGGSSGTLNKNEVHGDWQVNNGFSGSVPSSKQSPGVIADGGFGNTQKLKMNNVAQTSVSVPLWVIPSGNYSNSGILLADTASGKALKVTAVDSMGVLTLSDASTIDPNSGTDYKQMGAGDGPKCIPGSIIGAYTGSRGDVTANGFYTATGWRVLLKRKLKSDDTDGNDVDFSSLNDQHFGVGAMFNGADNQHAIVAGLTLNFKK